MTIAETMAASYDCLGYVPALIDWWLLASLGVSFAGGVCAGLAVRRG